MKRGLDIPPPPTPLALPVGVVVASDQIDPVAVLREPELNRDDQSQASFSCGGGPDDSEVTYSPADLLEVLLANSPDPIYFKDRHSRFVCYSQAFSDLYRMSDANALKGKSDFDLFTEEHARQAYEDEQRIIRKGEPLVGKLERETHNDGRVTWALTTKMPWRDRQGNVIGTFGISKDVTAWKEAETRLEETHKRLAHASRMAGMAEVATDILHNVGNVLNSVNVSCALVTERLQESPAANLARIPQMLREQAGRLDEFLTQDPKGAKIPAYLEVLAQTIESQRAFALQEMEQLRQHVDHIKQVVAMQQNYAKVAGVEEEVVVADLIEDAVQLNSSALERHQVAIRREVEPMPPIFVDKHKLLQILVNLISNAKYAVSAAERSAKLMTVRVRAKGPEQIVIQVVDNGVGISAENLTRIFAHGFTTRPDGHGFGLHSGAIAAAELGGTLTAESAGLGHGATFTLELPRRKQPVAGAS